MKIVGAVLMLLIAGINCRENVCITYELVTRADEILRYCSRYLITSYVSLTRILYSKCLMCMQLTSLMQLEDLCEWNCYLTYRDIVICLNLLLILTMVRKVYLIKLDNFYYNFLDCLIYGVDLDSGNTMGSGNSSIGRLYQTSYTTIISPQLRERLAS